MSARQACLPSPDEDADDDADDGDKVDEASDADDAEHGDYNGYADGGQTWRETLLPGERDGESGGSPGSRPCNRKLIRSLNIFTSQASTIKWQHMT